MFVKLTIFFFFFRSVETNLSVTPAVFDVLSLKVESDSLKDSTDASEVKCDSTNDVEMDDVTLDVDIVKDVEPKQSPDSSADIQVMETDISSNDDLTATSTTVVDTPKPSPGSPNCPEVKKEEIIENVNSETKEIFDIVSSQKVDSQDFGYEKVDESSPVEVAPIAKPEQPTPEKSTEKTDSEIDAKTRTVRAKAIALLTQWMNLQEVFKIPKKELLAMRAAHEREVDRAAAAAVETRSDNFFNRALPKPIVSQSGYERGKTKLLSKSKLM
jgi:hypothetical protein